MVALTCPEHGKDLVARPTKYGRIHVCTANGCTVACWDGSTSTPADAETRALRHKCHTIFDPLWRGRKRWRTRDEAYRWLGRFMGIPKSEAHFGMFTREQCQKVLAALESSHFLQLP